MTHQTKTPDIVHIVFQRSALNWKWSIDKAFIHGHGSAKAYIGIRVQLESEDGKTSPERKIIEFVATEKTF